MTPIAHLIPLGLIPTGGRFLQASHWFDFVISVESVDDPNPGTQWQAKDRGSEGVGRFKREMVADLFGKEYEVGFYE